MGTTRFGSSWSLVMAATAIVLGGGSPPGARASGRSTALTISGLPSSPHSTRSVRVADATVGIRFRSPADLDLAAVHLNWRTLADGCALALHADVDGTPGERLAGAAVPAGMGWQETPLAASLVAGETYHVVASCRAGSCARLAYILDRDSAAVTSGAWQLEDFRGGRVRGRRPPASPLFALSFADGTSWGRPYSARRRSLRVCGSAEVAAVIAPTTPMSIESIELPSGSQDGLTYMVESEDGTLIIDGNAGEAAGPVTLAAGTPYIVRLRAPALLGSCLRIPGLTSDLPLGPPVSGVQTMHVMRSADGGQSWGEEQLTTLSASLRLAPARCGDGQRQAPEECDGPDVQDCERGCTVECTCVGPPVTTTSTVPPSTSSTTLATTTTSTTAATSSSSTSSTTSIRSTTTTSRPPTTSTTTTTAAPTTSTTTSTAAPTTVTTTTGAPTTVTTTTVTTNRPPTTDTTTSTTTSTAAPTTVTTTTGAPTTVTTTTVTTTGPPTTDTTTSTTTTTQPTATTTTAAPTTTTSTATTSTTVTTTTQPSGRTYRAPYADGYIGHYDAATIPIWPQRMILMRGEANAQGVLVANAKRVAAAAGNTDAKFIFYFSLTDMDSRCSCFDQQFYDSFRNNHPEWMLRTSGGAIISDPNGPDRVYVTDIGNTAYIDAWADYALAAMDRYGWDGVFADNVFRGYFGSWSGTAINPRTGAAYTTAEYRRDILAGLLRLRARFDAAGKILVGNHTSAWDPATFADPIIQQEITAMHGVEIEDCVYDFSGNRHTEANWIGQLRYLDYANTRGVRTVCNGPSGSIGDPNKRGYILASYLLTKEGFSDIAEINNVGNWWSGLDIDLGSPSGRFYCLDPANGLAVTTNCPSTGKIYVRDWERGRVLVNPTSGTTATIQLGETLQNGSSSVTSVTLGPGSGVVLTRP